MALEMPLAVLCIVKPTATIFRCTCVVQANILLDVDKLMEGKIEAIIGLEVCYDKAKIWQVQFYPERQQICLDRLI